MNLTADEIKELIEKKKNYTKALIHFYKGDILSGVPYHTLLGRIKKEFDVDLSYPAFVMGVYRHLSKQQSPDNGTTPKPKALVEPQQEPADQIEQKQEEFLDLLENIGKDSDKNGGFIKKVW